MRSDSYPIPTLSLLFLYHPYIPYFLIQRILFHSPSFFTTCSHQMYNSSGGLAPKIGISTWTKMDSYSYEQALSRYVQVYFPSVIRASVDALCRDGTVQISRERVQRGRLTRQGTRS